MSRDPVDPYVPASRSLPEITIKAIVLGILLSILLAGANAYLGLLAGMTVSASIPAAVISMAVLRWFRKSNILENNIVQTAASAGESLAAGVIFTFPALYILKVWTDFDYWQTTIIAGLGGMIGVLFTIPLRRALVVDSPLKFPEGVATAEVLKVGDTGGEGVKSLALGGLIGALFKFGESGLGLWTQAIEGARQVGGSIAYFGSNLLPALVAVGYIVGINIALLVFIGGGLNWFIAIPIIAASGEWPQDVSAMDYAWEIWSTKTRYLGVGAMLVGGLWALLRMGRSLVTGITSGLHAYRALKTQEGADVPRTSRDMPMQWVMIALVLSIIPLFFVFRFAVGGNVLVAAIMSVLMLIAGFLFSAVASYMAGLVGSSNNPISGVTIATILTSALLLVVLLGTDSLIGPAAAIMIGAVVCCAAAIGGDNMQDLKAGQLLGATPRKQQIMQGVGVLSAAFVMAPILSLLLNAYGIVEPASPDREALAAPQATLMASVADGVFKNNLPWGMVVIGMFLAGIIIAIDLVLEAKQAAFRTPVLAVAVGIYLPLELATPILAGGLISLAANRFHARRIANEAEGELQMSLMEARGSSLRRGLLFAAGLITGEAVLGILLAIPIVMFSGNNPIDLESFQASPWPGVILLLAVMGMLYALARGWGSPRS
ncbi:MAG: oligopeptide transporter, OPT family [Deltaproteobacteria bacterium]|jgi:putative OPT family oligopeptide transporter|nr:oligopeptide transporter, OPT family [Deltaproteobacteria bacterium]